MSLAGVWAVMKLRKSWGGSGQEKGGWSRREDEAVAGIGRREEFLLTSPIHLLVETE